MLFFYFASYSLFFYLAESAVAEPSEVLSPERLQHAKTRWTLVKRGLPGRRRTQFPGTFVWFDASDNDLPGRRQLPRAGSTATTGMGGGATRRQACV